jgi:hypothetical protein
MCRTCSTPREGIEWNNHDSATKWWLLDADLALSRARFTEADKADPLLRNPIPGSIRTVASFCATVTDLGPWFGQFQGRYFWPRALDENNDQRFKATTLDSLRAGDKINPNMRVALGVSNRQGSDIDNYFASRPKRGPVTDVNDITSTPSSRAASGFR